MLIEGFDTYRATEETGKNTVAAIEAEFEKPSALDGAEVIVAIYDLGSYEGDAFVLFRKDGKLFEVNAGHCSCYGLEGQWEPEETTKEELLHRIASATYGVLHNEGAKLRAIIEEL